MRLPTILPCFGRCCGEMRRRLRPRRLPRRPSRACRRAAHETYVPGPASPTYAARCRRAVPKSMQSSLRSNTNGLAYRNSSFVESRGCVLQGNRTRQFQLAGMAEHKSIVTPSDILGGLPEWPKDSRSWDKVVGDSEIIYEDDHVVVFHDPADDDDESAREDQEIRATLISKRHVHSLMDLGVGDEQLSAISSTASSRPPTGSAYTRRASKYGHTSTRRCSVAQNSPSRSAPASRRTKPTPPTRLRKAKSSARRCARRFWRGSESRRSRSR